MTRSLKAGYTALLMVVLATFFVPMAQATELPDELIQLMPADPDVLVVFPSAHELDRAWADLRVLIAEMDDDQDEELPGLKELMTREQPEMVAAIDWDKPLAMTLNLPNMMMGQEPVFAFIMPVGDQEMDFEALAAELKVATVKRLGDYLLFSQDPEFVMATAPSPLLDRLPRGTVAMCANLQTMWKQFSPMLDFALMAATAPKPAPEGEDSPPQPEMSPEQVAALGDMVRTVMDSADILALGADLRGHDLSFTEVFVTIPGTVLDPGPQPDMQKALELTRLMDPDADWVGAYALDVNDQIQVYKEFYLLNLQEQMMALETEMDIDLAGVMEDYFATLHQFMVPGAFAMDLQGEQLDMAYVMATSDGQAIIERQMESQAKYGEALPFLVTKDLPEEKIRGHKVEGWDFEWDADQLGAMMTKELKDQPVDEDTAEILQAVTGMYQRFMPGMRMLATDDHFFVVMGRDTAPLKDMVEKARKNKGRIHKGLQKTAQQSGAHCQAVFQGDLATVLTMVFEMVEEFSKEDLAAMKLDPMPLSYIVRIDDLAYGVDYQVDLTGLPRFVKAIQELEELEDD
jgi:hypothetical protein